MTCGLPQICVLCELPDKMYRDRRGRFVGKGKLQRRPSPYVVEGRMVSMAGNFTKASRTPHLEFCQGCVERSLGRKLRKEDLSDATIA